MAKKISESGAPTKRIRLERSGVVACGPYRAGEVYEVEENEAQRLIDHKGFIEVADTAAQEE